jgi:outer membrane protein W
MKKILAVILAVVMMCGVVMAQDVQNLGTKAGDKSMNFTFNGLGTFGIGATGPQGGVGLSYFLGSNAAVRAGLQVMSSSSTVPANPGTGQTGTDGSNSSFTLALSADYLMYMQGATSRVRPYMGAGFSFAMTSSESKNAVIAPTVQATTKGVGAGTTLGLMGIAGAEFYLYPELSLSAEYTLTLFSMNSPADVEISSGSTTVTTKQTSSTQILGFGTAGAAIHIYF